MNYVSINVCDLISSLDTYSVVMELVELLKKKELNFKYGSYWNIEEESIEVTKICSISEDGIINNLEALKQIKNSNSLETEIPNSPMGIIEHKGLYLLEIIGGDFPNPDGSSDNSNFKYEYIVTPTKLKLKINKNLNKEMLFLYEALRWWTSYKNMSILQNIKIPEAFKKVSKSIYRYWEVNNDMIDKLNQGKKVSFKQKGGNLLSFTTDKKLCLTWASEGSGNSIVTKYLPKKEDIFLNVDYLQSKIFRNMLYSNEKEVLLHANKNTLTILPEDIIVTN